MNSNSKKVIITGAGGFVGANLARYMLAQGHAVHLFLRDGFTAWRLEELRPDAQFHTVNFSDADTLDQLVAKIKPDWIFHLAAYGAYSYQNDLSRILETNVNATVNLVEACRKSGFEAFVNTGSSSEYGFKDHACSEQEWVEPNSYYAVTKASATLFCRFTAQKYKLPISTLRLYSVYGPYEEPTRLMPQLIIKGLAGDLPPLVSPTIARDYVYSEDVNRAYWLAATVPGQEIGAVYNVGTGVQTSLSQVVEVARRVLNIAKEPSWGTMPDRAWDTSVWVADNRQIREKLGWQPEQDFERGFAQMVAWLKSTAFLKEVYK
jgi:UDP-glucose 4-epimerase